MRKNLDLPINVVVPLEKFSQLRHENVLHLAGIGGKDDRTIFSLIYDSRVKDLVVKNDTSQKYKSGSGFSSIATSVDGYVATGDSEGVVRLYNDISKSASFKLDQLSGVSYDVEKNPKGDPVIGIDISTNREWVVWTTKTFLALVRFDMESNDAWIDKSTKKVSFFHFH